MEILKATDPFANTRNRECYQRYLGESRLLVTDEGTFVEHCGLSPIELYTNELTVYSVSVPKVFLAEFGEFIEKNGGLTKYDAYCALVFGSNKNAFATTVKSGDVNDKARHICVLGQYYGWSSLTSEKATYGVVDLRSRWRLP